MICFLHVVGDFPTANRIDKSVPNPLPLIRSARRFMPKWRVVQMSDQDTPALDVDEVIRRPFDGNLMTFRLEHLAQMLGECVILDSDVVLMHEVAHVFREKFDVALTTRDRPVIDQEGKDVAGIFPYNTGVMFSRNPDFWRDCLAWLDSQEQYLKEWWGDQAAVCQMASGYDVLELPGHIYNWVPPSRDAVSTAYCWHYKGLRKKWLPS